RACRWTQPIAPSHPPSPLVLARHELSRPCPSPPQPWSIASSSLAIGTVVGLAFNRYARSWLARLGITMRSDTKAELVGIAGAFIGFHINVILGPLPAPLRHFILAGRWCHGGEGKPRAPSMPPPRYATCLRGPYPPCVRSPFPRSVANTKAPGLAHEPRQHLG